MDGMCIAPPERIESVRPIMTHWGVLAVIFGRHIPGMRIPITLLAGILRFPYPLFAGRRRLDDNLGRLFPRGRHAAGTCGRVTNTPARADLGGHHRWVAGHRSDGALVASSS